MPSSSCLIATQLVHESIFSNSLFSFIFQFEGQNVSITVELESNWKDMEYVTFVDKTQKLTIRL